MNRGIRPEFNEKLIELFENELREVRREDSLKIVKLKREEQPQPQQLLKRLLPGVKLENENTKDLTFSFNKYSKHPSLTVSPIKRNKLTKNSKFVKPNDRDPTRDIDPRFVKSMYDNIHLIPTQYSDDDDEEDMQIHQDNNNDD